MGKAQIEYCGSHFVEILNKKRRKLLPEYEDVDSEKHEGCVAWVDKIYAIRFDPPEMMEATMKKYELQARQQWNGGMPRNGRKGTFFRRALLFHQYVMKVFINGTHATCAGLSCVGPKNSRKHRVDHRSNQEIEGGNAFKNGLMADITAGGPVQGEDWLKLSKKLAKRTRTDLGRIDETGKFKAIRNEKAKRDQQYITVMKEFKADRINHDEYVRRIVKLRRMHDLPKSKKALLKRLESDSD